MRVQVEGVWVYAVAATVPSGCLDAERGVVGQAVRVVQGAGLAAAVTSVSLDEFGEDALRRNLGNLPWLEATARGHHRVVAALARHVAVVPLRLATVCRGEAGVMSLLAGHRDDLMATLARTAGSTEWGVKVYAVPDSGVEAPTAGAGLAAGVGAGAAYLKRRRQQLDAAAEARRAAAAASEAVHAGLSELANAVQVRPAPAARLGAGAGRMTLDAAYLVPDHLIERFDVLAACLAERYGVQVERTGPWPPYSFTGTDCCFGEPPSRPTPEWSR